MATNEIPSTAIDWLKLDSISSTFFCAGVLDGVGGGSDEADGPAGSAATETAPDDSSVVPFAVVVDLAVAGGAVISGNGAPGGGFSAF